MGGLPKGEAPGQEFEERETPRTAPPLVPYVVPPRSPVHGGHAEFDRRGAGAGPLHDWQRLEPATAPPLLEAAGGASERVDGALSGPGMPAAVALGLPAASAAKLADDEFHRTDRRGERPSTLAGLSFSELGEPIFESLTINFYGDALVRP